jgi:hypothetical protein
MRMLLLIVIVAVPACPATNADPDVGETDVGFSDDVITTADAPPSDTPDDAPPPDADSDGIPDDMDCAPTDSAVGVSATRTCAGPCGPGTETCSTGEWAACVGSTACICTTAGMTRVAACGMCGTRGEVCSADLRWEASSMCLGERTCTPGAVETTMVRCGVRQRVCLDTCEWGAAEDIEPVGECTPNPTCNPILGRCDETCHWVIPC